MPFKISVARYSFDCDEENLARKQFKWIASQQIYCIPNPGYT